jgi:hypothetical protein|tara:strand:+ start:108 stop:545 length:438 start_codon:yes stop_codon:yes gene_type:complete
MSKREDIASHIVTTIEAISSPSINKVTRQPFNLEELAQSQYPAVLVQTQEETKEDQELGDGAKTRICTLEFLVTGYIKGSESNIDTARNTLATAIETQLESDITRNSKALDTEVISLETDAGTLFPYGAISMVVKVVYEHESATP